MRPRRSSWLAPPHLLISRLALLSVLASCVTEASPEQLKNLSVTDSRLHLRSEILAVSQPLRRQQTPQLELELTLTQLPRDVTIPLSCDWRMPNGETRHHNAWQTKAISHEPWPTHCRYTVDAEDPTGSWTVVMRQAGRELGRAQFELE
jgi:hypothetical protein